MVEVKLDNYEKMFWGLLKFIAVLLLGICATCWGYPIVIGFILGVVFAYIVLRSWTVEDNEVAK